MNERSAQAQITAEIRPLKPALSTAGGEMPIMLKLNPEQRERDTERPRINLALVLDRSGSMAGEPLDQAKLGAQRAVELLAADDRVAIVSYDDEVSVVVPNMPAADKPRILSSIRGVTSGGTTALHAGWLEGANQVSQNLDPSALNRVVLLTDGLANRGETDTDTICGDVAGLKNYGVSTTTFGLGRQFNEDLLEAMAHAGGGNYYLAESAEGLRSIFAAELHGLSATIGRDARLLFNSNERGAEVTEVLNDLPAGEDGLALPDLIAGLPLEIGAILKVPALPACEAELGTVQLRWRDADGKTFELSVPVRLNVVSQEEYAELPEDPEVASLVVELRAARIKREATMAMDRGDRSGALKRLQEAKQWLHDAPQTERVKVELGEMSKLDSAMSQMDDMLARKRMKSQAYRKSRSFYHEKLESADEHADESASASNDKFVSHLPNDAFTSPGDSGKTERGAQPGDYVVKVPRPDGTVGLLELKLGDVTAESVDALLNPTNPGLFGTGRSVDGSVHRKGGSDLTRACREIGHVDIGGAVVTPGFRLPAQYVIHTAVPVWQGGPKDAALLAGCYRSALDLARRMNLASLAVPAVGAGTNGFPPAMAAEIALTELLAHLARSGAPKTVRVVLFDEKTLEVYRSALANSRRPA